VDPEGIAAAVERGEGRALAWLAEAGRHLGSALRGIETLLDPEAIVLGGSASPGMLRRLAAEADRVRRAGQAPPQLLLGAEGDTIPALGAAALPLFARLTPAAQPLPLRRISRVVAPEGGCDAEP
jgi:predicted NBD/HSP70 family sugar kinase